VTRVSHVVYVHGFASSPASSKATWLARELQGHGVGFSCPDLNAPDFSSLTVSRMIAQTLDAVPPHSGPVALAGSSLGAYVAVHAAMAREARPIDRLLLLAPAFDFGGGRLTHLGPHSVEEWRRDGFVSVFHYAYGESRQVGVQLLDDATRFDAFSLELDLPCVIVQGRDDDVVGAGMVQEWARSRPNVTLQLVDDGHQLGESMPAIWRQATELFGL
jgi:pimeloyl-ACP methyl ester carboxylesterase